MFAVSGQATVRGSDKLVVVNVNDNTNVTPIDVSLEAGKVKDFPAYKAGGLAVALIFHTATKNYVLGSLRENPRLNGLKTKDGKDFPLQFNSATGGRVPDPSLPLREAAVRNIKSRMVLDDNLCAAIEMEEGWEDQVCVHTDKWTENSEEKTMCVLTMVKHLSCSDKDLEKISHLSQFTFMELDSVIQNSCISYMEGEVEKAEKGYEEKIAVIFNDLAVATLAKEGAFQWSNPAPFQVQSQ